MSKYTTELRYICKTFAPGKTSFNDIVEASRVKIFEKCKAFSDDTVNTDIQTSILKNYYMREIGFETVQYFLNKLRSLYDNCVFDYNALIRSYTDLYSQSPESILYNSNLTSTSDSTETNKSKSNENITTNGESSDTITLNKTISSTRDNTENEKKRQSDTPQGSLSNLENNTYMSFAEINDKTHTDTGNETTSGTETRSNTDNRTDTKEHTDDQSKTITDATKKQGFFSNKMFINEYSDALKNFITTREIIVNKFEPLFLSILY